MNWRRRSGTDAPRISDGRIRKDGSRFWANGVMITLRDEAGGLRGFAKILRDWTERKEPEDALAELRRDTRTAGG